MVMIEDYEQALWGQYLTATGGGGDQTGAVGARGHTREYCSSRCGHFDTHQRHKPGHQSKNTLKLG